MYNLTNYPHLVGLFDYLGCVSEPSDMSFALSTAGGVEWGSRSLFAQPWNALSPSFWRMVVDVFRWGWRSPEVLSGPAFATMTLGEYVKLRRYSVPFVRDYLLPMCACIWSAPGVDVLAYPVRFMVKFFNNHHLLSIFAPRPIWRVLRGRSDAYVQKIHEILGGPSGGEGHAGPAALVRAGVGVRSVRRLPDGAGLVVKEADGKSGAARTFDAVRPRPRSPIPPHWHPVHSPVMGAVRASASALRQLFMAIRTPCPSHPSTPFDPLPPLSPPFIEWLQVVMATHTDTTLRL